jgi:hypothetical protein
MFCPKVVHDHPTAQYTVGVTHEQSGTVFVLPTDGPRGEPFCHGQNRHEISPNTFSDYGIVMTPLDAQRYAGENHNQSCAKRYPKHGRHHQQRDAKNPHKYGEKCDDGRHFS